MSTRYHVHVYWSSPALREQAMRLRSAFGGRFPHAKLGRIHDEPVAFHPLPMFQVSLDLLDVGALFAWLPHHREDLSLLVHPLTGDPFKEHLQLATWFGLPLVLDQQRLRRASSAAQPTQPVVVDGTLLRIDASARHQGSTSRELADRLIAHLGKQAPERSVVHRDLTDGVPLLNPNMLEAFGVSADDRSPAQRQAVQASEILMAELRASEHIVLALPIYNFGVPAAFKAWLDLVTRSGQTFSYTSDGPRGLLSDRPVTIVLTSGGTRMGGKLDFVTPWLRHVLGFIGLHDLRFVFADSLMVDPSRLALAQAQIDQLPST